MATAYVDSSLIVNVAFDEEGASGTRRRLDGFDSLVSSNLLEAEVRVAFARENLVFETSVISGIEWIHPISPLADEYVKALHMGYLRGADLWHIAAALYAFPRSDEITFLTLDNRQRAVAVALGFQV